MTVDKLEEAKNKIRIQLLEGEINDWEFIRKSNLIRLYERTLPVWFNSTLIS